MFKKFKLKKVIGLFSILFCGSSGYAQTGNPSALEEITKENFRAMTHHFESTLAPLVKSQIRKNLVLDLRMNEGSDRYLVKAEADQAGKSAIVRIFGGIPRHETMTLDGVALVMCHELGHHLAGGLSRDVNQKWSSAEGEADYWATHVCVKKLWSDLNFQPNLSWKVPAGTHDGVLNACAKKFGSESSGNQVDDLSFRICVRSMLAGQAMTNMLKAMKRLQRQIDFDVVPSVPAVSSTMRDHPAIACRFKTFIGGTLCGEHEECARTSEEIFSAGKPNCWHKPD